MNTDPNQSQELLPCPFCGSAGRLLKGSDKNGDYSAIECDKCGAGSGLHYLLGGDANQCAIDAWNTRARAEQARSEVTAPMLCPHCSSVLLWSEDRGAHCDGCDDYDPEQEQPERVSETGTARVDHMECYRCSKRVQFFRIKSYGRQYACEDHGGDGDWKPLTETDTPITDEHQDVYTCYGTVIDPSNLDEAYNFARKLETQLTAANAKLAEANEAVHALNIELNDTREKLQDESHHKVTNFNKLRSTEAQAAAMRVALDAFESKERGVPQAHMAAALVAELRAALSSDAGKALLGEVADWEEHAGKCERASWEYGRQIQSLTAELAASKAEVERLAGLVEKFKREPVSAFNALHKEREKVCEERDSLRAELENARKERDEAKEKHANAEAWIVKQQDALKVSNAEKAELLAQLDSGASIREQVAAKDAKIEELKGYLSDMQARDELRATAIAGYVEQLAYLTRERDGLREDSLWTLLEGMKAGPNILSEQIHEAAGNIIMWCNDAVHGTEPFTREKCEQALELFLGSLSDALQARQAAAPAQEGGES